MIDSLKLDRYNNFICINDVQNFLNTERYWCDYTKYKSYSNRTNKFEDDKNYGVPPINESFYNFLLSRRRIPTHNEMIQFYYDVNCCLCNGYWYFTDEMKNHRYPFSDKPTPSNGIECKYKLNYKILLAYMSFLKELYILTYLWSVGLDAMWTLESDFDGYDIFVLNHQGQRYAIKIFSETPEAIGKAKEKLIHRNVTIHSPIIYLPIKTGKNSRKIGDTCLPDQIQLNNLVSYIQSNQVQDKLILKGGK